MPFVSTMPEPVAMCAAVTPVLDTLVLAGVSATADAGEPSLRARRGPGGGPFAVRVLGDSPWCVFASGPS